MNKHMDATLGLAAQLRCTLGDLSAVEAQLRGPGARMLLERAARARAVIIPPMRAARATREASPGPSAEEEELLLAGQAGLRNLQRPGGDAMLGEEELQGLEALVLLIARPALFVIDGDFASPPEPWGSRLDQERDSIRRVFRSVGRIEVSAGGGPSSMSGTGFLVASDVVMTNRHVVRSFSAREQDTWQFTPGLEPSIDYCGERESTTRAAFRLEEVLGVHDSDDIDLALLRVSRQPAQAATPPEPLLLASEPPEPLEGRDIYAVGYPAADSRGLTPPQVLQDIFGSTYEVKRLQPGKVMHVDTARRIFTHDCSTLGGNSGSCVVDLRTGLVIGLHFGGGYRKANSAVALWALADDPLLRRAGVGFA
jgi:V8-like Glu-specific endopeptidase